MNPETPIRRAHVRGALFALTLSISILFAADAALACAGQDEPIVQEVGALIDSQDPVYLVVDGQAVVPNAVPLFIKNGRMHGELSSIFDALGLQLRWEGAPAYRITALKDDLELVLHLGCRSAAKDLYGKDAASITMDAAPFIANRYGVPTNRTVVPVSFVAAATGAEVSWDNATRTVTIESGRTWFFDWKLPSDGGYYQGTYIQYTDARYQEPMACPAGFALEDVGPYSGRWCASSTEAHGPFTQAMIQACGGTGACLNDRWSKSFAKGLRGDGLCAAGSSFEPLVKYCVEPGVGGGRALGPFPQRYRDRCLTYADAATCNGDRWPVDVVQKVTDTADLAGPTLSTQGVLDIFRANGEVFGVPLENNDLVSAGLFSPDGAADGNGNGGNYVLSEATLPPFVLSGRRQTDSLVRTAYLLLPSAVRSSYAFLLPDKVAQDPEAYLPYIRSKQKAMVIGAFMGPGGIKAVGDAKNQAVLLRQERELFKLRSTLALLESLGVTVEGVFYSIGDTVKLDRNEPNAAAVNAEMDRIAAVAQQRFDRILSAAGLGALARPLSFGGDELVHVAFAEALGTRYSVYVDMQDPTAKPRYDGGRTIEEIVDAKLDEAGLIRVSSPAAADLELYVFSRPAGDTAMDTAADRAFMAAIDALPASRRARTIVADARINNGALDEVSVPAHCDLLTWTGWGTGGNNIGFAIAQGKILHHAQSAVNARRLLLEAVAHDVYANGYQQAQWGPLKSQIQSTCGVTFNHHPGYGEHQADDVYCIFNQVTAFVSAKMLSKFPRGACIPGTHPQPFKFTAQMWRTFESEVHMWPTVNTQGEIFAPGVYRKDPVPGATLPMWHVLNPMGRDPAGAVVVDLAYLLTE
ncbi:MAG: DUF4127 family protein [Acidobacteriota bacterium]